MRRLLRLAAIVVGVIVVLAVALAAFGPSQQSPAPSPAAMVAQDVPEEADPLDADIPPTIEPTSTPEPPKPTKPAKPTKEPKPTKAPKPTKEARVESRCEDVPADVVAGIETGLTVDGGGNLRGAQAVRSRDFEEVWFVAADIQGPNMEGGDEIAVWALNDISAAGAGLIIPVDGFAKEFSDWGAARSDQFSPGDDGLSEVRECVSNAL